MSVLLGLLDIFINVMAMAMLMVGVMLVAHQLLFFMVVLVIGVLLARARLYLLVVLCARSHLVVNNN